MCLSPLYHSTSRITLRRFIRSSACTRSLLSSTASRRSTVRFASPRYSPKMRLVLNGANDGIVVGIIHNGTQLLQNPNSRLGTNFRSPLALRFYVSEAIAISRAF